MEATYSEDAKKALSVYKVMNKMQHIAETYNYDCVKTILDSFVNMINGSEQWWNRKNENQKEEDQKKALSVYKVMNKMQHITETYDYDYVKTILDSFVDKMDELEQLWNQKE